MTDTMPQPEVQESRTARKMNLALMALLDRLNDDVDARYPWDGKANTEAHVARYKALQQALGAIEKLLTAQPPDQDFRELVRAYVGEAWELTHGDPKHDETVQRAMTRATQDYQVQLPEQLSRNTAATPSESGALSSAKSNGKKAVKS